MAFSAADRLAVEQAMVRIATDGIATVTVAGETVTASSLDELRRLLELINADVAATTTTGGLRIRTLVPPECG